MTVDESSVRTEVLSLFWCGRAVRVWSLSPGLAPHASRSHHRSTLLPDAALAELHVQRAALYKTLCSFATTDADEGLEDAISNTKQVRLCSMSVQQHIG